MLNSSDPIGLLNMALCVTIVTLGYLNYKKKSNIIALFIAIAYAIFGISHVMTFFGLTDNFPILIAIIRLIGYFFIIYILQAKFFNNNSHKQKE